MIILKRKLTQNAILSIASLALFPFYEYIQQDLFNLKTLALMDFSLNLSVSSDAETRSDRQKRYNTLIRRNFVSNAYLVKNCQLFD